MEKALLKGLVAGPGAHALNWIELFKLHSGYTIAYKRQRAVRKISQPFDFTGADNRNRTGDLLITRQLLYQLSYVGEGRNYTIPSALA